MHEMTAGNLRSAFGGESMAHMRYGIWAGKAQQEGFANVSRLFRAIAAAEQAHAAGHFQVMSQVGGAHLVPSMAGFGLGSTLENLGGALEGELFEVNEMYPAYLAAASHQQEAGAQRSFRYALEAERIHAAMYEKARQAVQTGKDVELGPVHVCQVCGWTFEGEAPDKCPICNAMKKRFTSFV